MSSEYLGNVIYSNCEKMNGYTVREQSRWTLLKLTWYTQTDYCIEWNDTGVCALYTAPADIFQCLYHGRLRRAGKSGHAPTDCICVVQPAPISGGYPLCERGQSSSSPPTTGGDRLSHARYNDIQHHPGHRPSEREQYCWPWRRVPLK